MLAYRRPLEWPRWRSRPTVLVLVVVDVRKRAVPAAASSAGGTRREGLTVTAGGSVVHRCGGVAGTGGEIVRFRRRDERAGRPGVWGTGAVAVTVVIPQRGRREGFAMTGGVSALGRRCGGVARAGGGGGERVLGLGMGGVKWDRGGGGKGVRSGGGGVGVRVARERRSGKARARMAQERGLKRLRL